MSKPNIKLIADRVLIKPIEETIGSGLLIAPDSAKEKPQTGLVVATGKGKIDSKTGKITPMQINVGDKVAFNQHDGMPISHENETFLIFNQDDFFGVIE